MHSVDTSFSEVGDEFLVESFRIHTLLEHTCVIELQFLGVRSTTTPKV